MAAQGRLGALTWPTDAGARSRTRFHIRTGETPSTARDSAPETRQFGDSRRARPARAVREPHQQQGGGDR